MKLRDLVEFNPTERLSRDAPVPFVDMAALPQLGRDIKAFSLRDSASSGARFVNGDTLMARITPCLENGKGAQVRILPDDTIGQGSTEFIVLRARIPTDADFVYYLSRHPDFRHNAIRQMTGTSGRQRVSWQSLADYDLPDIEPRKRASIGSVLGALDDKIELNRRMNETLEAMACALFKDWFIDFGPTRVKMAGGAPYLSEDVWSLFPSEIDDEGKPAGWNLDPLGAHLSNFDSKRVPVSGGERAKRQGPFPYHGATGVMDHVDDYLFDGVFLLVGEDGSVVRQNGLAFTQYVWGKIWVNNHAHVLQGKGSVSTEQLMLYFQHETVAPYITGAVQLKLSQGRMNSMPFMYAGPKLCDEFARAVHPLFVKFRANADESKILSKTRDLLIPKLISGELLVQEAENLAGEFA
jgi:type I restriction enzyme S subunit